MRDTARLHPGLARVCALAESDNPIGPTVDASRDALAWLGKCKREQAEHSMHLVFRLSPESALQATLKLNVEINTRKHEALRTTYPRLLT